MLKRVNQFIILFFLSVSIYGYAQQDSLANAYIAQKNIEELRNEQNDLNFQNFFFQALQQKAIGNFDKAIVALENCQNIIPDEIAVNFEFGKNYFELERYLEAESFTKKALDKDPENVHILLLLKKIYNKQSNFKDALEIQKKIVDKNPDSQLDLVILYIKNNQIDNARKLLVDLEKQGTLAANLIPFKESLFEGQVLNSNAQSESKPLDEQSVDELKNAYKTNKSFNILKQILIKLNAKKQYLDLESMSNDALELFPAQPIVHLMNARALNQMKQYQKALDVLENGLDYVVDDILLEADYYEQMSLSYKGLSQNVNASKYFNMAVSLRQKKS